MDCRLCSHPKTHKHGLMPKGHQCYFCLECKQTFKGKLGHTLLLALDSLQSQCNSYCKPKHEGSSLTGISRITKLAYNTVVSIVRSASYKAQLVHNHQVKQVMTEEVSADEMWSFVQKNRSDVFLVN